MPFVPRAACRAAGVRCTCGATVWPLPGASPVRPLSEAVAAQAGAPIQPPALQEPSVTESVYGKSVDVDLEVAADFADDLACELHDNMQFGADSAY